MKPPVELPVRPLTPKQWKLYQSEPGLPEEAARAAVKTMGRAAFRHHAFEDMVSTAKIGALEAAQTYEPSKGTSYRQYAFFRALFAVTESVREERRAHARMRALLRASAMVFFLGSDVDVELGVDTEASYEQKIHGFSDTLVGLALSYVATIAPEPAMDDDLAEREAAARAGEALRALLPAPGTPERRAFDLHFVEGKPLTEVARALGIDERGYKAFWRRFHGWMAAIREGLEARGIEGHPP